MFGETQRVAPAVAGNSVLEEDLQRLSEQGFDYQLLVEPPDIGIVIHDVPLPEGVFSQQNTDVLLKTTYLYPQSEMDMFWVEPDLRLASGAKPLATNLEIHFDQPWRRFSWHRNCPWIPGMRRPAHAPGVRARAAREPAVRSYLAADQVRARELADEPPRRGTARIRRVHHAPRDQTRRGEPLGAR